MYGDQEQGSRKDLCLMIEFNLLDSSAYSQSGKVLTPPIVFLKWLGDTLWNTDRPALKAVLGIEAQDLNVEFWSFLNSMDI